MAFYNICFSPTGGTKKVADIIINNLTKEFINIDICKDIDPISLNKNDICLISIPSYGGRVPDIAITRIKKIQGNGAIAILNCVYGNREWEDTLTELEDTLKNSNFVCAAGIAAVAEHSIFRQYAKGRPNNDDKLELIEFTKRIKEKISTGIFNDLKLEGNHYDYKVYNRPSLIPQANNNCISCGACANSCPASAISKENPKLTDSLLCIGCMRCVNICPTSARDFDAEMMKEKALRMEPRLGGYKKNHLFL